MVCDFYVYTYLEIRHTHGICYIELEKRDDWFCDCMEPMPDSDDEEENHNARCGEYLEKFLKPSYDPILIYNGSSFLKESLKEKYLYLIRKKADGVLKYWRDTGELLDVNHILQIRKIEIREKSG